MYITIITVFGEKIKRNVFVCPENICRRRGWFAVVFRKMKKINKNILIRLNPFAKTVKQC